MFIIEIGSFSLMMALMVASAQFFVPLLHLGHGYDVTYDIAKRLAVLQCTLIVIAFCALTYGYIYSDFSVLNIVSNSHTDKPLFYKISGVWGNHEGSMLLWALVLSVFGVAMARSSSFKDNENLRLKSLCIQGGIGAMILGFIIFTSFPFERIFPIPDNGKDLNPLLQDVGLAFHPPLLYCGYIGFSAVFAVACAALWQGDIGRNTGRLLRWWCLIAWACLTAGIGLGMWWAYYELGWGGFWFWDAVENASLMPWLSGTALLHSAVMLEKRNILKSWTILLSIFTFATSLLGTFIVRSGIITSVHSFASSPERGIVILLILFLTVGGALVLYGMRSHLLRSDADYDIFSREGALVLNNYLMTGMLLIVFTGTLYPTFLEVIGGQRISVGAPYFNATIAPLMYMIAFLCPLAGFVSWKYGKWSILQKPFFMICAVISGAVIMVFLFSHVRGTALLLIIAGLWMITGTIIEYSLRGLKDFRKFKKIMLEDCAKITAHLAVGFFMIGIAGAGVMKQEATFALKPQEIAHIGKDSFVYRKDEQAKIDNYIAERVTLTHQQMQKDFIPERRYYPTHKQITTEADIHLFWGRDVYITVGEVLPSGKRTVNIRIHPLVGCLWFAMILAVAGAMFKAFYIIKQKKHRM